METARPQENTVYRENEESIVYKRKRQNKCHSAEQEEDVPIEIIAVMREEIILAAARREKTIEIERESEREEEQSYIERIVQEKEKQRRDRTITGRKRHSSRHLDSRESSLSQDTTTTVDTILPKFETEPVQEEDHHNNDVLKIEKEKNLTQEEEKKRQWTEDNSERVAARRQLLVRQDKMDRETPPAIDRRQSLTPPSLRRKSITTRSSPVLMSQVSRGRTNTL